MTNLVMVIIGQIIRA